MSGNGAAAGDTWRALKGAIADFREKSLTDWAAALTYYGLLSLFPAVIALVSIIGLVGDPETTTETITEVIEELGPESAAETFSGPIESIASNRGAAGFAFVLGLAVAIWSASGYIGAFTRASNVVYETDESRPFWKLRPLQIAITVVMVLLVALLALGLVLTGPIVDAIAGPVGLDSTAVTLWNVLKWPVMVAVFVLMISVLYYLSPDAELRGFRWVTPGGLVALLVWAIASAGFAIYVANFGSFDKTYGTLGGLVVLLVWLWITNVAILFGHVLNARLEREKTPRPPSS
jgi:membrane protein